MKAGFDQTERERERERDVKPKQGDVGFADGFLPSSSRFMGFYLVFFILYYSFAPLFQPKWKKRREKEKGKEVKYEEKSSRFSFPSRFILLHECVRSTIAWKV